MPTWIMRWYSSTVNRRCGPGAARAGGLGTGDSASVIKTSAAIIHRCRPAFSLRQRRHLLEAVLQVEVELVVGAVERLVLRGRLLVGIDLFTLLDALAARLLDAGPDARADAGEQGDAVGGALGGVGED